MCIWIKRPKDGYSVVSTDPPPSHSYTFCTNPDPQTGARADTDSQRTVNIPSREKERWIFSTSVREGGIILQHDCLAGQQGRLGNAES